jgi:D-alanyl-D-alanine carboxypeptidase/D-alanyl-D-alanine-endopeptidase (penicillin-binding protein 4)
MRVFFGLVLATIFMSSCAVFKSAESRKASKIKHAVEHSLVFSKSFTGFTLLDPTTGKTLVDVNGDHYFTPASNTKILTLATCLAVLGDSVPGLLYLETDTALLIRGTGDPTLLHHKFEAWQQIAERLRTSPKTSIELLPDPAIDAFGPGWAWDDAPFAYSAERSTLPVFGNVSHVYYVRHDSITVGKNNWHYLTRLDTGERLGNNKILPYYGTARIQYCARDTFSEDFEVSVPIKDVSNRSKAGFYSNAALLKLGLERNVLDGEPLMSRQDFHLWYSTPIDTVLRRMMHQSDNFIAEQMLLVSAGVKFDMLQQDTLIKWMLDSALTTLPQRPKWVDGSGLSRYNLMTPQSIAQVLLRLWKTQPKERLFSLFPPGGVSGTIENWYAGKDGKPYVFAKTGSMSGVHCLSGYVVNTRGKVLIFSFMHNNFTGSNRPWKAEMQRILELLAQ